MAGGKPRRRASACPTKPAKRRPALRPAAPPPGPGAEAQAAAASPKSVPETLVFAMQVRAICENKTWKTFCVFSESLGGLTLEMVLGRLGRTDLTLRCGGLCVSTGKHCGKGACPYVQFYDAAGFARALAYVEHGGLKCKYITLSFDAPSPSAVPPPDGGDDGETTDEDDPALTAEFSQQEYEERQQWLQRQQLLQLPWPRALARSEASGRAGSSPVLVPALPAVRYFDGDEVMGEGEGVLPTANGEAPQINGGDWVLISRKPSPKPT